MKNIAFLFTYFLSSFMNAQGVEKNEIILKGIEANNYIFGAEIVRLYPYTQIPAFVKFRGNSGISEDQAEQWLRKFAKFEENDIPRFIKAMKFLVRPIFFILKMVF